jgi:hypothetical protein
VTVACDAAQQALSALADGEPPGVAPEDLEAHVGSCADCRAFDDTVRSLRQQLRFEPVGPLPDLAPAVLARLAQPRPRHGRGWLPAVAAAAVGAVAGAAFVGVGSGPQTVAAADIPTRVVEVQPAVSALTAGVTVTEAGGPAWRGTLRYRAPEHLALVLDGPAGARLGTVAAGDRWWSTSPDRTLAVEHRAPFEAGAPAPLELVSPVDSLAGAAPLQELGTRTIEGVDVVGVRVTAAQVADVLDGVDPTGALRPVHPTDEVDLWLDDEHLVPIEVVVRAAPTPERARWAAGRGIADAPGDVVLTIGLHDVDFDADVGDGDFPAAPAGTPVADGGFVDGGAPVVPVPTALPEGMDAGRAGTGGDVGVRTWSDGRAWLAVRATEAWPGGRLFGLAEPFVVPVDLGAAGFGYASPDGDAVALHGLDVDVVVEGSVGRDVLTQVAASLGVAGRPVPGPWADSKASSVGAAVVAADDLLVLHGVEGFGEPAARIDGEEVRLRYVGPGDLAVEVVRSAATVLPPPIDPDVVAVAVRGTTGRYDATTGDLEWVEGGHVRILRGPTLGLDDLLALAERLAPP